MTQNWWQALYDDLLVSMLLERPDQELDDTANFLEAHLGLRTPARVFDQCCGIGNLGIHLARRGHELCGVDQSEAYINRARRDANAAGVLATFVSGDAFEFTTPASQDAAFNWWTGFGYTSSDSQNSKMLARAFASLRPGGVYALDFINVPGLFRNFQRSVSTRRSSAEGELVLVRESELDLAAGVINKRWTYFLPNGQRINHDSRVRLYLPHTLDHLLQSVGFEAAAFYGDIRGNSLTLDSDRCIVVARRPK